MDQLEGNLDQGLGLAGSGRTGDEIRHGAVVLAKNRVDRDALFVVEGIVKTRVVVVFQPVHDAGLGVTVCFGREQHRLLPADIHSGQFVFLRPRGAIFSSNLIDERIQINHVNLQDLSRQIQRLGNV